MLVPFAAKILRKLVVQRCQKGYCRNDVRAAMHILLKFKLMI